MIDAVREIMEKSMKTMARRQALTVFLYEDTPLYGMHSKCLTPVQIVETNKNLMIYERFCPHCRTDLHWTEVVSNFNYKNPNPGTEV